MITCRAGTGRIGTRVGWMKACRVKLASEPNASGCSTITYEPASIAWGTPACSPSMDVGRWTVLRPGLSGPVSPLTTRTISAR